MPLQAGGEIFDEEGIEDTDTRCAVGRQRQRWMSAECGGHTNIALKNAFHRRSWILGGFVGFMAVDPRPTQELFQINNRFSFYSVLRLPSLYEGTKKIKIKKHFPD